MVRVLGTAVFVWDQTALQPQRGEPEVFSLDVT